VRPYDHMITMACNRCSVIARTSTGVGGMSVGTDLKHIFILKTYLHTYVQRLRMDISRLMVLYKCSYYYL